MNRVAFSEIIDIAQYEKIRDDFRRRIIELKKRRRIQVGPSITFVFENHDTVLSQIQEMMRAERIVNDAAIKHEIDTYNELLPDENELAATMFIELKDPARIREEMTKLLGINSGDHIYLKIGEDKLPGIFAAGQSDDHRISAVQYVRFRFKDDSKRAFKAGENASIVIDHPNYKHAAAIAGIVREELSGDFD